METDVLVFEVEGQRLGLRATHVTEVLRAVTPLPLPKAPAVVMGMINLRGRVIPVLNMRMLLNLSPVAVRHTDHLVVIEDDELNYAIHVDRATDLSPLQLDASADGDDASDPTKVVLVANTADGFVQMIDPACLLSDQDRAALMSIVSPAATGEKTP